MSTTSIGSLEAKASEQRSRLHRTASDLREKVEQTREQLSVSRQAHDHLLAFSVLAGLAAFLSGYGIAGAFTRD